MAYNCCSTCCGPSISSISIPNRSELGLIKFKNFRDINYTKLGARVCGVRASMVDSSYDNSIKRMELAWLISKQPRPVSCASCDSNGHVECKWCGGTGFFIIGDNMLCQVPSRNTSCVICAGKGSACCSDCKGTGFRAKWLEEPPVHK